VNGGEERILVLVNTVAPIIQSWRSQASSRGKVSRVLISLFQLRDTDVVHDVVPCWSRCCVNRVWMLIQYVDPTNLLLCEIGRMLIQNVDPKLNMLCKMLIQNVDPKIKMLIQKVGCWSKTLAKCWSRCWSKMLCEKGNVDPGHVDPSPVKQLSCTNWLINGKRY
jgi:hypothetical protein